MIHYYGSSSYRFSLLGSCTCYFKNSTANLGGNQTGQIIDLDYIISTSFLRVLSDCIMYHLVVAKQGLSDDTIYV